MNTCFTCGKEDVTTELCDDCLLGGNELSKNTVTNEQITELWTKSKWEVVKMGEKTCVVTCTTPSGFVIVESSSCVDPANYNETIGYEICKERIINKLWELEGYCLQKELSENEI